MARPAARLLLIVWLRGWTRGVLLVLLAAVRRLLLTAPLPPPSAPALHGAHSAYRRARIRVGRGRSGMADPQHGPRAGAGALGLDRRPQHPHRCSLGFGRSRPPP